MGNENKNEKQGADCSSRMNPRNCGTQTVYLLCKYSARYFILHKLEGCCIREGQPFKIALEVEKLELQN